MNDRLPIHSPSDWRLAGQQAGGSGRWEACKSLVEQAEMPWRGVQGLVGDH